MSKSLGNGIDPVEVADKYGADVLRLWVSSVDYSQDVSVSDNIFQRTADGYRRIRNTYRFLLGSLADFDEEKDAVRTWDALEPLDQWAYVRTLQLLEDVTTAYGDYKFHNVYRAVYDYIVNDLSAIYMDATKDRLYSEAAASPRRRAVQTVLMNVLEVLVRVMAPILSFTTDEVWEHYPEPARNRAGRPTSVQLAGWPHANDFVPQMPDGAAAEVASDFATLLEVREAVTKALEEARDAGVIKKSQEAAVCLTVPAEMMAAVAKHPSSVIEEMLIVASVDATEGDELTATVARTDQEKCERCWNYRTIGTDPRHPDLCERCACVVEDLEA